MLVIGKGYSRGLLQHSKPSALLTQRLENCHLFFLLLFQLPENASRNADEVRYQDLISNNFDMVTIVVIEKTGMFFFFESMITKPLKSSLLRFIKVQFNFFFLILISIFS